MPIHGHDGAGDKVEDAADEGTHEEQPATADAVDDGQDEARSDEEDDVLDDGRREGRVAALDATGQLYHHITPTREVRIKHTMPAMLKMYAR